MKKYILLFFFTFCIFAQDLHISDDFEIILDDEIEIILEDDDDYVRAGLKPAPTVDTAQPQEGQFVGSMPVQIEFVDAEYDSTLFEQGIAGDVVMNILINEEGTIDSVAITESLHPILDEAAIAAAKRFVFQPALLYDSIPVAVIVQYVYRFSINTDIIEEEIWVETLPDPDAVRDTDFDDFEVVAYFRGIQTEVAVHRLTINEMRRIPGLSGDAVKVVQALPGVARPTATTGTIVVRGTSQSDSRFLLDGTDILLLYHFGGLKSTYNSEALEAIEFFPGGWGVNFGDATGGIVKLQSRRANDEKFTGHLDLNMLDMSFLAEGPISPRWSLLGTARRSHFGELLQMGMRIADVQDVITIAPYYWDYVVRADFAANDRHRFTFSSFSSNDSLAVILGDDVADGAGTGSSELRETTNSLTQRMFFSINGVNWDFDISDNLHNYLTVKTEHIYSSFGAFGFARSLSRIRGFRWHDNLAWQTSEQMTANFGFDGYFGLVDMEMDIINHRGTLRWERNDWLFSRTGVYTNLELKPTDRWLIIPGIRYDYYGELNHSGSPSFRLSSRFSLNDEHLIKGAIGTYNQSPKPQGMVIDTVWGNPNLPPTKAAHFVLGYERQITDLISLDVQAYINRQWNIPRAATVHDIRSRDFDDIEMYYPDGIGRSRGIEIMLRHDNNDKFFGWIAYTLSKSERKTPSTDTIAPNTWVNFSYDQTHNFQILASYKLPRNWDIGGRLRYTTGNPTTPIIGTEYNLTTNSVVPIRGVRNSERMDPFFQFDFRVDKRWQYQRTALSMYFDIQNMLFFVYRSPELILYNDFYTERHVISMPIIPSLGVRFDF